jgi:hypothetical protein
VSQQTIDYYDSLEAPKANSLVPSVNVVVVNDAGEILLIRRTDNGIWAAPRRDRPRRVSRPSRAPSSESSEVRWIPASELPSYTMDRSMRIRIHDFLSRNESLVNT